MGFYERIQAEKSELEERISKLRRFLSSQRIYEIDTENRFLLVDQLSVMEKYCKILALRLRLLSSDESTEQH